MDDPTHGTHVATPEPLEAPVVGLLAEFETPDRLLYGCRKLRDAGLRHWDGHSPFPIHGMEKAMGLKASPVPWFVLVLALTGAALGMLLQWWVSTQAYALVVSGKPYFSWPAFVPIMFECAVLGGALGAIFGFLILARLPRHHHPLFDSVRFERASDDRFFLSVEARDPGFDAVATRTLLEDAGAVHVETVHDAPPPKAVTGWRKVFA
jgi:hypothetical protein